MTIATYDQHKQQLPVYLHVVNDSYDKAGIRHVSDGLDPTMQHDAATTVSQLILQTTQIPLNPPESEELSAESVSEALWPYAFICLQNAFKARTPAFSLLQ